MDCGLEGGFKGRGKQKETIVIMSKNMLPTRVACIPTNKKYNSNNKNNNEYVALLTAAGKGLVSPPPKPLDTLNRCNSGRVERGRGRQPALVFL